jgi:hypothetical protein
MAIIGDADVVKPHNRATHGSDTAQKIASQSNNRINATIASRTSEERANGDTRKGFLGVAI